MSVVHPAVAVFDAYGTLFDVHSAVARLADAIGPKAPQVSALWRQKQLEYSWTYALMRHYVDFWQLTQEALDYALASVGQNDPRVRVQLLDAYRTLDAYQEVASVLDDYRRAGLRVAVFSNATPAMLDHALDAAQLRDRVDAVFSVHALACYKPDPRVYDAAAEAFGVAAEAIAFHSSNAWDAAGAAATGWRTRWINRSGVPAEYPSLVVPAVRDLAQARLAFLGHDQPGEAIAR
ncbi:MAG: haloacid dehalogenase type II [Xanthomonadaceae bacterium]|nr:haloacid dehalogenase type II [Xanthomonadaceae bacterium]MDE2278166.1 haloacid dehalogenase type II [Xanthomonadaceae bacterium]MDE2316542.1 haloacid dehalogenase type II [Xanthomonadaceae bacterium]